MINYPYNIANSGLTIYDPISPEDPDLYIPTQDLEEILAQQMIGLSLAGLPLRTRSKVVKTEVCTALGYPVLRSFKKTQPRFLGQNFDVYTQKSFNVQIWNEEVDASRRYVFFQVNADDIISAVRVITGEELVQYDRTGTLTRKYQATMNSFGTDICSEYDTDNVLNWGVGTTANLAHINPNYFPNRQHLLSIDEIYRRLAPLVGKTIRYLDQLQERNRGAELHEMICKQLGYQIFEDDGQYPDIANQLLEVKLQTSPTIDLGLHSPVDGAPIVSLPGVTFYSNDIRYAIFDGQVVGNGDLIVLRNLYLVTGEEFTNYFPLFQGGGVNAKIQLPLPYDFFEY